MLAVAFLAVALVPGPPEPVDGVVAWLAYVNVSLLVFNLVPAAPLDGGRVLHSVLWRLRRDFVWATRVASGLGRGFGFLLIAGGIALLVFESAFSGAWLAFLGWFLLEAAGAESRAATAEQALGELQVRDLMARDPVTVTPDETLGRLMDDAATRGPHSTYPVVENGDVVGLLPLDRIALFPRGTWDRHLVREGMLARGDVTTLQEGDRVLDALALLSGRGERRALVFSGPRLVGVLALGDVAGALDDAASVRQRRRHW